MTRKSLMITDNLSIFPTEKVIEGKKFFYLMKGKKVNKPKGSVCRVIDSICHEHLTKL